MKFFWIVLIGGISLIWTGCIPINALIHTYPDYKDAHRSPSANVQKGGDAFHFYKSEKNWGDKIKLNDFTSDLPTFQSIRRIVKDHKTAAFLIIRQDSILYEEYFEGNTETTALTSFSIAKSFTSALVGIAIEEGYIGHIDEKVIQYLPQLSDGASFDDITIRHLLNQTSGIQYDIGNDAHIYYGKDIWKGLKNLRFDAPPGKKQYYSNINTQLLGLVLEKAIGQSLNSYLSEKIWQKIGMESDAFWNTDKNGIIRSYCCLNATARDYAKFARLFLKKGRWQEQQIIPESWITQSLSRDTLQGSSHGYNHSWFIGLKEYGDFMAVGLYKQYLYIHPAKELIIVSLHRREKKLKAERANWPYIFRQIADLF